MKLKFMCTCLEKKPCSHQKFHEEYIKFLDENKILQFKDGYKKGRQEMKKEIEKVIDEVSRKRNEWVFPRELKKRIGELK